MEGMLYIQEWTEWAVKLWGKFREMRRERIKGSRGGGESKSKGGLQNLVPFVALDYGRELVCFFCSFSLNLRCCV